MSSFNLSGIGSVAEFLRRRRTQRQNERQTTTIPQVDENLFEEQQRRTGATQDQILGLLNTQLGLSERNRLLSEEDRERALGLLQDRLNQGPSEQFQSVFDSLGEDVGGSPLNDILQSSIQGVLDNPDVFTGDQISQFSARAREDAARAAEDAISSTRTDLARRGVQGGIQREQTEQIPIEAQAQATQQIRDIELAASQARSDNLARAQQLGVSLEQLDFQRQQERGERLRALANFVTADEARDLETTLGMAEILANTVRENPDLSGFASILGDFNQQTQDLLLQKEQLEQSRAQLEVQQRLGIANADNQQRIQQQQAQFNNTLNSLFSRINRIQRDLSNVGNDDDNRGLDL